MPLDQDLIHQIVARMADLDSKGSRFMASDDFEAARLHFMGALNLDSNNPGVLSNLAAALYRLHKYEAGAMVARRALAIAPQMADAWNNLAVNLVTLGQIEEARAAIKMGLKLRPKDCPLHHTLGSLLYRQNKFDQAASAFKRAIEFGYDAYPTRNDLALSQLSLGNLKDGLPAYEVRWQTLYKNPVWGLSIPEWQGENLEEKSIIVHHEQGFGDSIMLARFLPRLQEVCKNVVVATSKPLVKLFQVNFPEIEILDCEELPLDIICGARKFDFHSPFLSMMRHLNIKKGEIPSKPYLKVDEPLTRPFPGKYKIGICWSSGFHSDEMKLIRRIVPLEKFFPLAEIPGSRLISLQKGKETEDIFALGADALIIDPMNRVSSFYDTARIVNEVDFVVTVCTSVAHLAGAMGKKVFCLLQKPRFWAYWNSPSALPWYENFDLYYRDEETKSWDAAMARVVKDVKSYIKVN